MKHFLKHAPILVVMLLAFCLALIPSIGFAAEPQAGGQGIQVSPVLIDLNAEQSQSYTLKITVTNITAGKLVLRTNVADFRTKDETGAPAILGYDESNPASYSFKNWVSPLPNLTLASKESRQVNVKVTVPKNAEAGGHYGVIRFSGVPPELAGSNVALTASVGVLVLARIEGQITEQLAVKQIFVEQVLHTERVKKAVPENGPLVVIERLENTGNVHVKPNGIITIKNFFGSTVASLPLTSEPKNVLPHSIRRFEQTLPKKWLFGKYTISLNANYGTTGKTLSGTSSFWIIPYKLLGIFLILFTVTVLLGRRALKRYNAKIIKKHHQSKKQ